MMWQVGLVSSVRNVIGSMCYVWVLKGYIWFCIAGYRSAILVRPPMGLSDVEFQVCKRERCFICLVDGLRFGLFFTRCLCIGGPVAFQHAGDGDVSGDGDSNFYFHAVADSHADGGCA